MKKFIIWSLQILVAVLFLKSAWMKFSGNPGAVMIFDDLGMGAAGRLTIGGLELAAALLLLAPAGSAWGALLAWGLMSGALIGHCTILGWDGPRAMLGAMAAFAWLASGGLLVLRRHQIPFLRTMFERDPHVD